ncbi:phage tail tape measure protein, partial [Vibrio sp. 10N.286.49.E1]
MTMISGALKVAWATMTLGVGVTKTVTVAMWGLSKGVMSATWAFLKLSVALLANPIFLISAGVVAAIAAVGALIYYWADLKASFGDTTWFQVLEGAIALITLSFRTLFEFIKAGWQWVM